MSMRWIWPGLIIALGFSGCNLNGQPEEPFADSVDPTDATSSTDTSSSEPDDVSSSGGGSGFGEDDSARAEPDSTAEGAMADDPGNVGDLNAGGSAAVPADSDDAEDASVAEPDVNDSDAGDAGL